MELSGVKAVFYVAEYALPGSPSVDQYPPVLRPCGQTTLTRRKHRWFLSEECTGRSLIGKDADKVVGNPLPHHLDLNIFARFGSLNKYSVAQVDRDVLVVIEDHEITGLSF